MSVRKVKEAYCGWDRYDPNVESCFADDWDTFTRNDMPDLVDLYMGCKGQPEQAFIDTALEHGYSMEDIEAFFDDLRTERNDLYKYEGIRRKRVDESFWVDYLSLSKKIYSLVKGELAGKKHELSIEDIQMAFDTALDKIQDSSDKLGL